MSKNASKCAVYGCSSKGMICHRFPNPKDHMERLLKWIKIVGLQMTDPYLVYKQKFICEIHFSEDCSSPGTKKLNANSYPSLNLPSIDSSPILKSSVPEETVLCLPSTSAMKTSDVMVDTRPVTTSSVSRDLKFDLNLSGVNFLDSPNNEVDYVQLSDDAGCNSSCNLYTSVLGSDNDAYSDAAENASELHVRASKHTSQKSNSKFGLLKKIGVKNYRQLTPKCKKFYNITNALLKNSQRDKRRKQLFKTRLQAANKFTDKYLIGKLSDKMTAAASLFMHLQVRETKKSSRGHRFSLDEKMLSLSLYKRSPKCYRMLSKLFTLPSKRTLNNILSSVKISPGICPLMMKVLTENVKNLKTTEKYCSILFDEICLSSGLVYNTVTDEIDGFVNTGLFKSQNIADHALVFMVRGIKKKFKQPIMYTFCQGSTKQEELVDQLKKVIRAVHQTGLRVVATISDQGTANVGALKILNNETRQHHIQTATRYHNEFYEIELDNQKRLKLVHIFDVPHLIKCIRNNLLTKNLNFTIENEKKCAKWSHLEELYNIDSAIPDCKMLPRLTDQHIVREKISKMKVKCATQIFSQRVSSTMNFLASRNIICSDATDTASLCNFFDKLFDSLNGSFDKVVDGKIYRTAIKRNSLHHDVWARSLKVLGSMTFIDKNGKSKPVPTIKNWMTTIRSFQTLTKVLHTEGVHSLLPRHLNQDPLECFFGAIRSIGSSHPNCHAFASAYKTLVLNNLVSSNSPGSNCEEDFTEGSLTSFRNLFESATNELTSTPNNISISANLPQTIHQTSITTDLLRQHTQTYIAGFIVKKLNKTLFNNCKTCLTQLCTDKLSEDHILITAREYQTNISSLKYPSSSLRLIVQQIITYVGENMSTICLYPNIHYTLTNAVSQQLTFPLIQLKCPIHQQLFQPKVIELTIKMMLNHYCTEINRILLGKRQLRMTETDLVKKIAHIWYTKHSKARKTQGKFNLVPK